MLEKIIKGIKYRLNEETMTAEVIAKRNGYEGDIIIPETVVSNRASYLVTSIGKNAFFDCKSLTSITLLDSIKSIGFGAFMSCESVSKITLPDSVKSIESYAFFGCRRYRINHQQHLCIDEKQSMELYIDMLYRKSLQNI